MKEKKLKFVIYCLFLISISVKPVYSIPMYSPDWGFYLDLPEDYEYYDGNGIDRYSFGNEIGANFDILIYHEGSGRNNQSTEEIIANVYNQLNNVGSVSFFNYMGREAWIMELSFYLSDSSGRPVINTGWALFMELDGNPGRTPPFIALLAYSPYEDTEFLFLHLSALDSFSPSEKERLSPGPITEFSYPRDIPVLLPVFNMDLFVLFYTEDAEAAQAVIDREFRVLSLYADSFYWREAWQRFYRAIFRDSYERLLNVSGEISRHYSVSLTRAGNNRDYAEYILSWVQTFNYERDFLGSDFINLVTAATEGRGDCDSRALLWAVILNHAEIPSGIMVSRYYSHAMGLAELPGTGARFDIAGYSYLVAETTARVGLGLIAESMSDPEYWVGVLF